MKSLIIMAALAASSAFAAEVNVGKSTLGSGTPLFNNKGHENAKIVDNAKVENNVLHAPQYMPNFPTAATIWPRVVEVPCVKTDKGLDCEGYNWNPSMGRGEYLFITPRVVEPPKAEMTIVYKETVKEVLVEVPKKKKKE